MESCSIFKNALVCMGAGYVVGSMIAMYINYLTVKHSKDYHKETSDYMRETYGELWEKQENDNK